MTEERLKELEARCERDPGMSAMRELIAEVRRLRGEPRIIVPPMPESDLVDYLRKAIEEAHAEVSRLRAREREAYAAGWNDALSRAARRVADFGGAAAISEIYSLRRS